MNTFMTSNELNANNDLKPGKLHEEQRRYLVLKNLNFFGFKVKRWATIGQDDILIFKNPKTKTVSRRLPLEDLKIVFPTPAKHAKRETKRSDYVIKFVYENKKIYWLRTTDEQDFLLLKAKLTGGIEVKKLEEAQPGSHILENPGLFDQHEDHPPDFFEAIEPNISPTDREEPNDDELNSNDEADLNESMEEEGAITYDVLAYSSLKPKHKANLETKLIINHSRKISHKISECIVTYRVEDEGPMNLKIPLSNFDLTHLKAKSNPNMYLPNFSPNYHLQKSQTVDSPILNNESGSFPILKSEFAKFATTNFVDLSQRLNVVKEIFDDEVEEQYARRKASKREFPDTNAYTEIKVSTTKIVEIKVSTTNIAEINESGYSARVENLSPIEDYSRNEDSPVLRKLTAHGKIREIKDDYKVFKRMQSKKENNTKKQLIDSMHEDNIKTIGARKMLSHFTESNTLTLKKRLSEPKHNQINGASVEDAVELFNCFELKQAKELFLSLSKENPRLKIFAIECNLVSLTLTGFKEFADSCLNELVMLSNQLGQISTSPKTDANLHFENEITKAECILYRGLLNIILNNKWHAFLCLSESWRMVHRLEGLLSNKKTKSQLTHEVLLRTLFAIGTFNLAFSFVPAGLLKWLKFIGISANKELGLTYLRQCWNAKFTRSMHSALLICYHYLEFELDAEKACEIIEGCLVQFCQFPLFSWIGAMLSWRFTHAEDAEALVNNGIDQCKDKLENPIFLNYELGWYYFITAKWDSALEIFLKLISSILKPQFFKNFQQDAQHFGKMLRQKEIHMALDFGPFPFQEAKYALFPHLTHILLNISACYFETKNLKESDRWLIAALIANKKYLNYNNKTEHDFGRLTEKFLKRKARRMLVFELLYFLKQLQKLSDEHLLKLNDIVKGYMQKIPINPSDVPKKRGKANIDDLVEFASGTLIITVNNCLLGESASVISESQNLVPIIDQLSSEFAYLSHNVYYWFGRAGIAEEDYRFAGIMLRKATKIKTNEFNLAEKSRKLIQQFNL